MLCFPHPVLDLNPPAAAATERRPLGDIRPPGQQGEVESPFWVSPWDNCDISRQRGRGGSRAGGRGEACKAKQGPDQPGPRDPPPSANQRTNRGGMAARRVSGFVPLDPASAFFDALSGLSKKKKKKTFFHEKEKLWLNCWS